MNYRVGRSLSKENTIFQITVCLTPFYNIRTTVILFTLLQTSNAEDRISSLHVSVASDYGTKTNSITGQVYLLVPIIIIITVTTHFFQCKPNSDSQCTVDNSAT